MLIEYKSIDLFGKSLFTRATIQTPTQFAGPMPNDEACFAYILEGESITYSEKEEIYVRENEAVLSKCGNYVTKMLSRKKDGLYVAITIHFHSGVLKKVYENDMPKFLLNPKVTTHPNMVKVAATNLIKKYIEGVIYYFNNQQLITEDILILKLKEIILLLLQTDNSPHILDIFNNLFSKRTFTFKEVIETHICSNITLAELALLTHNSLSSFKREFKKIYNETPAKYIVKKRTEKVAEELLLSDETISHIAFGCGFKTVAHLSKVFKATYGVTPTEYRQQNTGKTQVFRFVD